MDKGGGWAQGLRLCPSTSEGAGRVPGLGTARWRLGLLALRTADPMVRVVLGRKAEANRKCPLGLVEKKEQWTSTGPVPGSSITPKSSVQNTSTIQTASQNPRM